MTPDELVRIACPKIAAIGPTFYFAPDTLAAAERFGLDPVELYYLGRAGVLGDVGPAVVTSAFGFFEPGLVERIWEKGRRTMDPRQAGVAYLESSAMAGRRYFEGMDLDAFCRAAGAVNDAASPVGLPVYAGISAESSYDSAEGSEQIADWSRS